MKIRGMIGAAAAALLATVGVAHAQEVGRVVTIGEQGSVLVVRGNQTYALSAGDLLFDGDQVFTRTNGKAQITYHQCNLDLDAASFIVISNDCAQKPAILSRTDTVGGVKVAAAGAGQVGATPFILPALLAAGGAAAAGGGGSSSP